MSQYRNLDRDTIVATDRMNHLLAEAKRVRLIRQAKGNRPQRLDFVLADVGDLLISVGERLQARRMHMPPQSCDVCCADYGVAVR